MNKLMTAVLLHSAVQMLLILGTNRIVHAPPGYASAAVAAVIGGIYSAACLSPGLYFLGNGFWRLVSLGIMAYVAFPGSGKLHRGALFILLSLSVSAVTLENRGALSVLLAMIAIGLICMLGLTEPTAGKYVPVILRYADREISLTALRDTGHHLKDPITGQSVLIVDARTAYLLAGLTVQQLQTPYKTLGCLPGSRLVPYHTVGQPCGMLLAARLPDVSIGNWRGSCLVAFSPNGFENEKFKALVGGII